MSTKKNLIGNKFGSLTVIQEAGRNKEGRLLWLCQCICGEERIVAGKDLGKKVTRCLKKCILTKNLIGKRFGNLLVLSQAGSDKHGFRQFLCRCITPLQDLFDDRIENTTNDIRGYCGNEFLVNAVGLKQSNKNSKQRKVLKSCLKCSRILQGKSRRRLSEKEDLSGRKFGRLTALKKVFFNTKQGNYKRPMYECVCECGSNLKTYVREEALIGITVRPIQSCGCLRIESLKKNKSNLNHGLSKHPLYKIRARMIGRCYNENDNAYPRYGGRGIRICEKWLKNPVIFVEWAEKNGWIKGLTIDRIDNNGHYCEENCQIVTRIKNILKMQVDCGKAFFLNNQQININQLSKKNNITNLVCRKLLSNGYSINDVFKYAKLTLFQKNLVGRSISKGDPISITRAAKTIRITPVKKAQSSEMGSYRAMMSRCYNSKNPSYKNYGAKGIGVCQRWRGKPSQFLIDMGPKPKRNKIYCIDRICPKKNYSPKNCRWLSTDENSRRVNRSQKSTTDIYKI